MEKQRNKRNKIIIGSIVSLGIILGIYFGMSVYFMDHYYFGTVINSVDVSGKTVEEAEVEMESEFSKYSLELQERNGQIEQISAADINFKYNSNGQLQSLKDEQSPYKWISSLFDKKDPKTLDIISYDKELLKQTVDKLSCFIESNIVKPESPKIKYTENGYAVEAEIYGNQVIKDALYDNVVNAVENGKKTLDLEANNCYENPKYTIESQEVIDAKKNLDKYISSVITYTFGSRTEELNASTISEWLSVDENFGVIFDESKVKKYVNTLSYNYATYGKTRSFTTSVGKIVPVSGGNYGWLINTSKEVQELIATIKEGKVVTKEPVYAQTAASHDENDIGKTYVEINMTKQHLWFYKNGSVVASGDVVTGNIYNNASTPTGTFRLNYKQKGATLKGEDYNVPVSFWMPFSGNVGIHDATWRTSFGGEIYKSNGSHGCVNAPPYLAKAIFENIEEGTPIICYYE